MKKYLLITIVSLFGTTKILHAQEMTKEQMKKKVDSLERIFMRDSLKIPDGKITRVFEIRNKFRLSADSLLKAGKLQPIPEQNKDAVFPPGLDSQIRVELGEQHYKAYKKAIENRVKKRSTRTSVKPITTDSIHP